MKNIKESKKKNTASTNKEEEIKIIEPPQINPPAFKNEQTQIRGVIRGLPPEYAIAILPHISNSERADLIKEIGKENERHFIFFSKKRRESFFLKVFSIIVVSLLLVFFVATNNLSLVERLLQITLAAFGGAGLYIAYQKKAGRN